ncbi:MAG: maleylpyruvate isomerase family mycothiol-dependent enzyme [Streptosporangiales bacterium]|nr:maleylpyruvate isomerase family mycothiol-dependent enzyme [Streptosporangiales bacterium]
MTADQRIPIPRFVDALRREGELLALAAERAALDDEVATCPGWRLRDLLRHVGGVHRWATHYVAHGRDTRLPKEEDQPLRRTWPADDGDAGALVRWFRDGVDTLTDTLAAADPHLDCWHFLPAPSGTAFWARRQYHETTVHRVDVELVSGAVTTIDPDLAVDGIDEVLHGMLPHRNRPRADPPLTLALLATDTGTGWHVTIGEDSLTTKAATADASCTVRGTADDLYLLVWNRPTAHPLAVEGDEQVLDLWRAKATI